MKSKKIDQKIEMKLSIHCVLFAFCLLTLSSATEQTGSVRRDNSSAVAKKSFNGKSQVDAKGESGLSPKPNATFQFNKKYSELLSGEAASNLEVLNDSAEIEDDDMSGKFGGSRFDEFILPEHVATTMHSVKKPDDKFGNVYKVPKSKNKKTISTHSFSSRASPKSGFVTNDFNPERLSSSIPSGNASGHENYFHIFTSMFDHFLWNVEAFSSVSKSCLEDVNFYLNELRASKNWAVKASDASGRYRGSFFFDNDYWLGSKQFCYEINYEFRKTKQVPPLQFFVVLMTVKLHPITAGVS